MTSRATTSNAATACRRFPPRAVWSGEGRSAPMSALRSRGMVSMTTVSADWADILMAVALEVLGQPAGRRGNEWRYGLHESLVVNIGGQRAGTWRDFEAGHGGGTLELLRHYQDIGNRTMYVVLYTIVVKLCFEQRWPPTLS